LVTTPVARFVSAGRSRRCSTLQYFQVLARFRALGSADTHFPALFAALMAYGRVDLIARALTDATARMGPRPAEAAAADDAEAAARRFEGFVYRFTRGPDLARVWHGVGAIYRSGRTLEDVFLAADRPDTPGAAPDLRPALSGLRAALLAPTADAPPRPAFEHFFPEPARGSATKRLWLFLRWVVRGPDAIDLGLWRRVSPARLTMPVDTQVPDPKPVSIESST
jgi:uncharacterized protein (TIGR02757 family)